MSLYKRGRIWWCEWEVGGQRIRESTYTTDRKAAQEFHDRRRADIWREARLGETRVAAWDEAALAWVDEHAQHKKSYETDRQRLLWLTKRLTGQPITAISTDALLKLRKALLKDRAPATANRYLAIVSAVLHYAHAKSIICAVPKIPYLPEARERFRWLTRDEAKALIAELPKHLASMARFALATGLRRANVTGLTWDAFDSARRVAWIWPDEAKAGKPIAVPLNDDALAVLAQQRALPATWDKTGKRKKDPRYVFTHRGKPVFHTTTKAWNEAIKRAGIAPGFTFHDLRHTWASWHVMGGTPLPALQQLGGWASLDMVMRYSHLAPGYVAGYAENASLTESPTKSPTTEEATPQTPSESLQLVG
jgi:integrase